MRWSRPDSTSMAGVLRLLAAVLNGAGTLLLGRLTGSEPMGVVALSTTAALLSMTLCTGGIPAAVIRFGPHLDEVGASLRAGAYRGALMAAGLAGVTVLAIGRAAVPGQAGLAAVLAVAMTIGAAATNRLILRGDLMKVSVVSLVSVATGFALGLGVLAVDGTRGVLALSVSAFATAAVTAVAAAYRNPWTPAPSTEREAGPTRSEMSSFVRRAWCANALQTGVYRSTRWCSVRSRARASSAATPSC